MLNCSLTRKYSTIRIKQINYKQHFPVYHLLEVNLIKLFWLSIKGKN